jgi:dipeptidyl aminopeptidase/acylaminoacyl peptidase
MMKRISILLFTLGLFSCSTTEKAEEVDNSGSYSGVFKHGNFSDTLNFQIEQDTNGIRVFFTSLAQNANRIPMQGIEASDDSINFHLQSDFYTYSFKNKWTDTRNELRGSLTVDTLTVPYVLKREENMSSHYPRNEEISFASEVVTLHGTIWHPANPKNRALIILTSSGNADRSASRAEAILFAQMGFTTFHYDKRGTGDSEGDWVSAPMERLVSDDIQAIRYFSAKTGIPLNKIGIKGSSQGATKVPQILGNIPELEYGIAVSCPGASLLESDLNYWKNSHAGALQGDLDNASALQRKVFEFIAGERTRENLEKELDLERSARWFEHIWIPDLEDTQTDTKLIYTPIPYFETTKQPVLNVQGSKDEIIPANSSAIIAQALQKAGNNRFETIILEGASHSMYYVGESDFPYWSKVHPDYFATLENWILTLPPMGI